MSLRLGKMASPVPRRIILLLGVLLTVASVILRVNSETVVYKYDTLSRLIEVDYPDKKVFYTYDAAGNRISTQVVYLVPAPTTTNLNRTTAVAGGTGFTLVINGTGFDSNSIVQVNGSNRATTFISNTQLAVQILASDVSSPGTMNLTVLNQSTGGVSNSQFLTIYTPPLGQTFAISGQVIYANGATPVKNVAVNLTGSQSASTVTDANGNYSFSGLAPGGEYTVSLSKTGDVNGISAFDASLTARFAIGLISLTTNQRIAADASNNGTVSALDASLIARTALNIANPGIAGTWKFVQPSLTFGNLSADQTGQNNTAILVGDVSGNWAPPLGPSRLRPLSTAATITVALPVRHDPPGGTSTIPITVGDLTSQNVFSYDFDVTFDPAVLQPQNPAFDSADTLSNGLAVTANTSTPGHVRINAFSSGNPIQGEGALLKLRFNVVGAQGSQTDLSWVSFNFNEGDPGDNDINGQFTAAAPTAAAAAISGRVATADGQPVSGTTITVTGGPKIIRAITDADGNYNVENLTTGELYTVTPSRANYVFAPTSRSFSLISNRTDATFTAMPVAPNANPLDSPEFFVRQHYLDFLGREPEQGGLDYWSSELRVCGTDEACIKARRIGVSAAFFASQEFQQTGSFIYGLYEGALGRPPTYGEYSANRGRVVAGANLEADKAAFAEAFVQHAEFMQRYPSSLTAESFVDALLAGVQQSSGVDLNDQRTYLINLYNSGANATQSRSTVVRSVVEGDAFKSAEYNSAFVLMEYFGYLRRDIDQGGYDFWLDILNNREPNNYRAMVCAFITSAEYQQRFSPVATRTNAECSTVGYNNTLAKPEAIASIAARAPRDDEILERFLQISSRQVGWLLSCRE